MDFLKKLVASFIGGKEVKVDDSSPKGKLDKIDVVKTVRNLLLGVVAAGLTQYIEDPETLAKYGTITVVGLKTVFDILHKFMKNNEVEVAG